MRPRPLRYSSPLPRSYYWRHNRRSLQFADNYWSRLCRRHWFWSGYSLCRCKPTTPPRNRHRRSPRSCIPNVFPDMSWWFCSTKFYFQLYTSDLPPCHPKRYNPNHTCFQQFVELQWSLYIDHHRHCMLRCYNLARWYKCLRLPKSLLELYLADNNYRLLLADYHNTIHRFRQLFPVHNNQ